MGNYSFEISKQKVLILSNGPRGSNKNSLFINEALCLSGLKAKTVIVDIDNFLSHLFIKKYSLIYNKEIINVKHIRFQLQNRGRGN